MENDRLPYISVIITAYNRKEFLLNAIKSAINQTLDKKYYEIIVIKNFEDKNIDEFINENKIVGIISNEESLGGKLVEAINIARGAVISFLEDDDLFFENKLDIVYKEFKKNNNIVYYHNLRIPINKNGKTININSEFTPPDINLSSISIKKSVIKVNKIDKINLLGPQDALMYLYALESNKKIIKGKEKLTYYMVHNSDSNIVTNSFEEYRRFVISNSNRYLNNYLALDNLFHSRKAVNFINSRITSAQIDRYALNSYKIPSKLVNYLLNSTESLKYRIKHFLICVLIEVYPKSRKYFSNKIWDNHNKLIKEII